MIVCLLFLMFLCFGVFVFVSLCGFVVVWLYSVIFCFSVLFFGFCVSVCYIYDFVDLNINII